MLKGFKRQLIAALCLMAGIAGSQAAADPNKVLRISFEAPDSGFDMPRTNNSLYSSWVGDAIYESLLGYDYLARPVKLVPRLAASMPEVSADGKELTFKIKKGAFFAPDPAFKNQKREATAQDVVYSLMRVVDPAHRSPQASSYEGKIVGLDALIAAARKGQPFDYSAKIPGLEVIDSHTLKIRLLAPSYGFLYLLAHATAGVVAKEVVEAYGADIIRHPVGTGPYMLKEYVPRSKIVLEANPNYTSFTWNFKSSDAKDAALITEMTGKQMPQIGRIEISIVEEDQSRWLAFDSGQFDIDMLAKSMVQSVMDGDKLKAKHAHFQLDRFVAPEITQTIISMKDPVLGGYSKEKIALRRAISLGFNINDEIKQLRFGQALRAQSPIPPGMAGHDSSYKNSIAYNPQLANKLLDKFGYKKGADGFRTLPDGKPLVLQIHGSASGSIQATNELWKRSMDAIGLRTSFPISNFGDNLKAANECKLMMWGLGGSAGIPDGSDFLESYYGPNSLQGNLSCYQSAEFDKWYDAAKKLPDGPERTDLYNKMNRKLEAENPQVLHVWVVRNFIIRPHVRGFKKHPIMHANWMYLDLDMSKKK
mgnify:CR=1 FL=1